MDKIQRSTRSLTLQRQQGALIALGSKSNRRNRSHALASYCGMQQTSEFLGATEIIKLLYAGIDLVIEINCQYS